MRTAALCSLPFQAILLWFILLRWGRKIEAPPVPFFLCFILFVADMLIFADLSKVGS